MTGGGTYADQVEDEMVIAKETTRAVCSEEASGLVLVCKLSKATVDRASTAEPTAVKIPAAV